MNAELKLQHLYWRAGFGLSPKEWKSKKKYSISKAVHELFRDAHKSAKVELTGNSLNIETNGKNLSNEAKAKKRKQGKRKIGQVNTNWVMRMGDTNASCLLEKMSLFWHGHFACTTKLNPKLAQAQLNTIRKHALGNFKGLVLAMSKDVSMIRFLNNQQNRKRKPNENFARELMELFTIGRGNYTEQDVKEAARAFTGWSSNLKGEFVFNKRQHDFSQKTFFGKKGKWDGTDVIDMILERKETAFFITQKIYRFFVNDNIDERKVLQLADSFYDSNYDIEKLLRNIFESKWFYNKENVGVKIKSPVELIGGMLRTLDVELKNPLALIFIEKALGQVLFRPPNVAGWAGGKSWIDNSTLMLRLNLANVLFQNSELNIKVKEEFEAQKRNKKKRNIQAQVNFSPFYQLFKNDEKEDILKKMSTYLLQPQLKMDNEFFKNHVIINNKEDLIKTMCLRLMSLPEYQLC